MRASRPALVIIAAMAENRVIGRANRLPWHLPADLKHFKTLTIGKPLLMGRTTWESLPGPLPGRRHLVLTRDPGYRAAGCTVVHSLDEALAAAGDVPELMVIGGSEIYAQTLPVAKRLHLTLVHAILDGDTWFPPYDPADWVATAREHHGADGSNPYAQTFVTLDRVG
jgi:dihydrofolate reductase